MSLTLITQNNASITLKMKTLQDWKMAFKRKEAVTKDNWFLQRVPVQNKECGLILGKPNLGLDSKIKPQFLAWHELHSHG